MKDRSRRNVVTATALTLSALVSSVGAGVGSVVELVPPEGTLPGPGSWYNGSGREVAVDGDVLLIGARWGDFGSGAATIHRRVAGAWVVEQELEGGEPDDLFEVGFGASVGVRGDVAVVGKVAQSGDLVPDVGAVAVYRHDGASWQVEQVLTAPAPVSDDIFGFALAFDGARIAVAAPYAVGGGSVTVFRDDGGVWVDEAVVTAEDLAAGDAFGWSLAIDGDLLVVGAPRDNVGSQAAYGGLVDGGTATVFRRIDGTWTEEIQLRSTLALERLLFGNSVAVLDDVVVVGAPALETGADSGSVSVFRDVGGTWVEERVVRASDVAGLVASEFGHAVSLDAQRLVVGAPSLNAGGPGQLVVFERTPGGGFGAPFVTSVDAGSDELGRRLCVSGSTIAAVASGTFTPPSSFGSVFVAELGTGDWSVAGSALSGVAGEPELAACGALVAGGANELRLASAAPSAPAALFVGAAAGSLPFKGGTLEPFPFLLPPLPSSTGANGVVELAFTWPGGVAPGTELWCQFAIADDAAPAGVALSNAVVGTVP